MSKGVGSGLFFNDFCVSSMGIIIEQIVLYSLSFFFSTCTVRLIGHLLTSRSSTRAA